MGAMYPIKAGNSPNPDIIAQAQADVYIAYAKRTEEPQETLNAILECLKQRIDKRNAAEKKIV